MAIVRHYPETLPEPTESSYPGYPLGVWPPIISSFCKEDATYETRHRDCSLPDSLPPTTRKVRNPYLRDETFWPRYPDGMAGYRYRMPPSSLFQPEEHRRYFGRLNLLLPSIFNFTPRDRLSENEKTERENNRKPYGPPPTSESVSLGVVRQDSLVKLDMAQCPLTHRREPRSLRHLKPHAPTI